MPIPPGRGLVAATFCCWATLRPLGVAGEVGTVKLSEFSTTTPGRDREPAPMRIGVSNSGSVHLFVNLGFEINQFTLLPLPNPLLCGVLWLRRWEGVSGWEGDRAGLDIINQPQFRSDRRCSN